MGDEAPTSAVRLTLHQPGFQSFFLDPGHDLPQHVGLWGMPVMVLVVGIAKGRG